MSYLITVGISALTFLLGVFGVYNYVPISIDSLAVEGNLGAITTLVGTENLSDFPTTYNANLAQLMRMSTSSVDSITTLSNLVSIGTITTGVWGATDVTVANGGTGLSTLTANAVMLGAGTSNVNFVSGLGSSGQFLTSNGAASDPTWQTSSISLSDSYAWTGLHDWTATTSYQGVAAFYGLLMLGSGSGGTTTLDFSGTAENTASGTVMVLDAAGGVSHLPLSRLLVAEATTTVVNSASTTVFAHTITANTLGSLAVVSGRLKFTTASIGDADDEYVINLNFGDDTIASTSATILALFGLEQGVLEFSMIWDGTNQYGEFSLILADEFEAHTADLHTANVSVTHIATQDTTVDQLLSIVWGKAGADGDFTMEHGYLKLEL